MPVLEGKKRRERVLFLAVQHVAQSSFTICRKVNTMPLQVSLNAVIWIDWGGAKVKPDHGGYLAMIELHKTDNLIRLSLYELIRVLLREYNMSVFTIFPILYCSKTQHLNFSISW